jgi:hypothetical protein
LAQGTEAPAHRTFRQQVRTDALKELPSEQLHAQRALTTLLGAQTRMIAGSPLEDLDRPNEPVDRDRLLSDKELVAIYGAAQKVGYPFGHIIHTHCDAARGSRRTLLLN